MKLSGLLFYVPDLDGHETWKVMDWGCFGPQCGLQNLNLRGRRKRKVGTFVWWGVPQFVLFTRYCSTHGETWNLATVIVINPEGNELLARSRCRWENSIKTNKIKQSVSVWTGFIWLRIGTSGRLLWRRKLFHVSWKARNFFNSWETVSFWRRNLFHGVI